MRKGILFLVVLFSLFAVGRAQNQFVFEEGFEYPNYLTRGWSQVRIATAPSDQTRKWVSEYTVRYVKEGSTSAKLESMPVGNLNHLISPKIGISAANKHELSFWMYRSLDRLTNTPEEGLKVWVSSDRDTANGVMLMHVRRDITQPQEVFVEGWYQYKAVIPIMDSIRIIFQGVSEGGLPIYIDEVKVSSAASCSSPLNLVLDSVDEDRISVSWTDPNNGSWMVKYQKEGDPIEYTKTVITSTRTDLSGLEPGTNYKVKVEAICMSDNTLSYGSNELIVRTACGVISHFPWKEGFESSWTPAVDPSNRPSPNCWTTFDYGVDASTISSADEPFHWSRRYGSYSGNQAHSGMSYAACYTNGATESHNDWLITPRISLDGNQKLSFWVRRATKTTAKPEEISVWITSQHTLDTVISTDLASGFVNIYPSTEVPQGDWQQIEIDLSSYHGEYHIAFVRQDNPFDGYILCLDDVEIDQIPTCVAPTNLQATHRMESSVDISVDEDAAYTSMIVSYSSDEWATVLTTTFSDYMGTLTGLTPNTFYKVTVKILCDTEEIVSLDTIDFRTSCSPIDVSVNAWTENFASLQASGDKPSCMEWERQVSSHLTSYAPNDGEQNSLRGRKGRGDDKFVSFKKSQNDATLFAPLFNLVGGQAYEFSFWYYAPTPWRGDVKIYLTTGHTSGDTLEHIGEFSPSYGNDTNYHHFSVVFTPQVTDVYSIAIFAQGNSQYGAYLSIDDLRLGSVSSCPMPQRLTVGDVYSDSAQISWTHPSATSFVLSYRTQSDENYTAIPVTGMAHTLTGLTPNTSYLYKLTTTCSGTSSLETPVYMFQTICREETVPFIFSFSDEEIACWEQKEGLLSSFPIQLRPAEISYWRHTSASLGGAFDGHVTLNFRSRELNHWLISPIIDLGNGSQEVQLDFEVIRALNNNDFPAIVSPEQGTSNAQQFAVVISTDGGETWGIENAKIWDSNGTHALFSSFTETKTKVIVPLRDGSGNAYSGRIRIALYAETMGEQAGHNYLHIDNFRVIPAQSCQDPFSLSKREISASKVEVSFSATEGTTEWEYEVVRSGEHFTGTSNLQRVSASPFVISGLTENQAYKVRMRTVCTSSSFSSWTDSLTFKTFTAPVQFPYQCDFETAEKRAQWNIVQQYGGNAWILDSVDDVKRNALYIAPGNSVEHRYDRNDESFSLAFIDVKLGNAEAYKIAFDWKCNGNKKDFMQVLWQTIEDPLPSTPLTRDDPRIFAYAENGEEPYLLDNSEWKRFEGELAGRDIVDSVRRLVFVWSNDDSRGNNPPAAIDNLSIESVSCPPVSKDRIVLAENTSDSIVVDVQNWNPNHRYLVQMQKKEDGSMSDSVVSAFPVHLDVEALKEYAIRVRTICAVGDSSMLSAAFVFETPCEIISVPYVQDLSSTPFPCWAKKRGMLTTNSQLITIPAGWSYKNTSSGGGDQSLMVNIYGSGVADWLISPPIDLGSGRTQLDFEILLSGAQAGNAVPPIGNIDDDRFAVVVSTDDGATWSSEKAWIWGGEGLDRRFSSITEQKQRIVIPLKDEHNVSYTGVVRIAFYAESTVSGGDNYLNLSNLKIDPEQDCLEPSLLYVDSLTDHSATIAFTPYPGTTTWEYESALLQDAFTGNPSGTTVATRYTIENLSAQTFYKVRMRAKCNGIDYSSWTDSIVFRALSSPVQTPFRCDFEDDVQNGVWNYAQGKGTNRWAIGGGANFGGNKSMYIGNENRNAYNAGEASVSFAFIDINFDAAVNPQIIFFDWRCKGMDASDFMKVFLQDIDSAMPQDISFASTTNVLAHYDDKPFLNGDTIWRRMIVPLDAGITGTKRLIFAWKNNVSTGGGNPPAAIDNLYVGDVPTCEPPTELMAYDITKREASLAWTERGIAQSWIIELGGTETINVNSTPRHRLTSLNINQSYTVRVKSVCSATEQSAWSEIRSFSTMAGSVSVVVTADVTGITETTAQLNGSSFVGEHEITQRGFEWKPTSGGSYVEVEGEINEDGANYSMTLADLTPGTSYVVRAFIVETGAKKYGVEKRFSTTGSPITGLTEIINSKQDIRIYPNPATEMVSFDGYAFTGKFSVFVEDLQGRKLLSKTVVVEQAGEKVTLKLQGIVPGVYHLRLEQDDKVVVRKLIVR